MSGGTTVERLGCLGVETLVGLRSGLAHDPNRAEIEAHVAECSACREVLAALADSQPIGDTIPDWPETEILPPGARVGRYLVLEHAASGGMGVVYQAHDPELSRKVALKLLRPDRAAGAYEDRLRREAQSLAQLAHPNVVAAYDAGVIDGRIFIAMEYVEGQTLHRWLLEERRPWREAMAKLCDAGRGLAAAHAAGLVHRDFKPDNVLLGRDGRARVADFGLARLVSPGEVTVREDHLGLELTVDGLRMGTPAFMSPEQHRGDDLDAASDQFSFCVSLYYALYGQLPFTGLTWEEIGKACSKGEVREPPRGTRVPRRVHRALMRGLSIERADRYPSMVALLDALERDPFGRWKRTVWFASSLAVLAGATAAVQNWTDAGRLCHGAPKMLEGAWDPERRAAIELGLSKTGAPYAPAAIRAVTGALDRFASSWVAMHVDACEATRVRGEQTEEILGLRMACLGSRLGEVRALGDRFVEADAEVAENAVRAVEGIADLSACADLRSLTSPVRPPSDPEMLARVDESRVELARVRSFLQTGHYREGLEAARPLAEKTQALGYRPVEAEASYLAGVLADEMGQFDFAEKSLAHAVWAAEAGRHDELAARGWIRSIRVIGDRLGRHDEARALAPRVTAALERSGGNDEIEASLLSTLAVMTLFQGQYADAERDYQKSLALLERRFGKNDLRLVEPLRRLAFIAAHRDESDRALEYLDRALAIQEAVYQDHPEIAATLETVANAQYMAGRTAETEAAWKRALAIRERALGKEHPSMANLLHNYAITVLLQQGDRQEEAVAMIRRAVALDEKHLGSEHEMTLRHTHGLTVALHEAGHLEESLALLEGLLPKLKARHGNEHPILAEALHTIALLNLDLGHPKDALAPALESHAMNEKMMPEYNSSSLMRTIGRAHLAVHHPADAVAPLERARAQHLEKQDEPAELEWTNALLGQALVESGRDRARGRQLGLEALAYMKKDLRLDAQRRELEAWMKKSRVR